MEGSQPWARSGGASAPDPAPPQSWQDRADVVAELRSLRRWVIVAGIWAVAASAIALVALFDSPSEPTRDDDSDVAVDLTSVRQALDRRLDRELGALESRVEDSATSADVNRLTRQVRDLVETTAAASSAARRASARIDALGERMDAVEQRQDELEARQEEQARREQRAAP